MPHHPSPPGRYRRPPARNTAKTACRLVLLNKPYGVLCQFSDAGGRPTLADYLAQPGVYPAGRLDRDSEGLVLLTNDGALQHRISDPRHKHWKTYWVQVEGDPDPDALDRLRAGVALKDGMTRPARARPIDPPPLWPRDPPIRFRRSVPTHWIELALREGRNRQVRRMTAAVGLPTLRLVRCAVGDWHIEGLAPGQWRTAPCPPPPHRRSPTTRLSSPARRTGD